MNDSLPKLAELAPYGDETLEQASLAASEVVQQMLAQKLELEDKKQSVAMLQKALVSDSTVFCNVSAFCIDIMPSHCTTGGTRLLVTAPHRFIVCTH